MKKLEEIDYNTKILNFMTMTETSDPNTAKQYLIESNWDETLAVNSFFNKIRRNISTNSLDIPISNTINSINLDISRANTQYINQSNNSGNDEGFFDKYIFGPLRSLFNSCSSRKGKEIDKETERKIFQYLPNRVKYNKFTEYIKKHLGIIILYDADNITFLNKFISQISRNSSIINILKKYFIILPCFNKSEEGINFNNSFELEKDNNLIYPLFIFCYSKLNPNNILDKTQIIFKLQGNNITFELFHTVLINLLQKYNFIKTKFDQNEDNYMNMTDGEVLLKQKEEMEKLEMKVQQDEERIKKMYSNENNNKNIIEERKNVALTKIVEEPKEGDPDSTTICFRFPDGDKRKDRRFLKSHTIQNLYDYVASLGNEIYTESSNNNFSLFQPFPPKKYENMDNTLEKEGLFPNAVIQIKEE